MRSATIRALEYSDEAAIVRGMTRSELEAQVLEGDRASAIAPPDVSSQLRFTTQAEADALAQAADAQARHDQPGAYGARTLALWLTAECQRFELGNARYERWAADTRARRESAERAGAELQRRGHAQLAASEQAQSEGQAQTMTGWWQQFEADIQAVERVITRQHQAAIAVGDPWPPQYALELDPVAPWLDPEAAPEDESVHNDTVARLDKLLAQAEQAAQRIVEQQTERQAASDYAARIEWEAQARPEAAHNAEPQDQAEMEL